MYFCTVNGNNKVMICTLSGVTGLAQWLERWTGYPKGRGFESRQKHNKNFEFFRVKKVVLTRCRCAQPPVCVRTHTTDHVRVLKIL